MGSSDTSGNVRWQARRYLRELGYPSNLLTVLRLLLLLPTLRYLGRSETQRHALACMGLAMLTDALDGEIARQRGEVSELGQILDPIADKLVIDSIALRLVQTHAFPLWVAGLLLFRDVGILLAALVVYRRRAHVTVAQLAGKSTTLALTVALLLYMADGARSGKPVLYMALVPFSLSFWQYGRQFVRLMREHKHE
jgi:CDP-diacylglycerol--glycerol-3-phosphate 3-phosphatidyltransferase